MDMQLENISAVQARISQIQSMVHGKISSINSQISSKPLNFEEMLNARIGENPASQAKPSPAPASGGVDNLKVLCQNNSISCGQTSVAMAINCLTGKNLIDSDIDQKYGFQLLNALNGETKDSGVSWKDGGTISPSSWSLIEQKVNNEKIPVVVGLNGPEFSPSGRGHIVTITRVDGDTVYFADPSNGTVRTTTKDRMNNAPSHPDGNFIFYGSRGGVQVPNVALNNGNINNLLPLLTQMKNFSI
jgi:hypothetical protein